MTIRLSVAVLMLAPAIAWASPKYFHGHAVVFERAETYQSAFGGTVVYLTPGGYDEFHDFKSAMLVSGVITTETVRNVLNLLERYSIGWVYLDSPGGDLGAGLALGKIIHGQGMSTGVTAASECESACALAFLGGKERLMVALNSKFGFHRQYRIIDGKVSYAREKEDARVIAEYLSDIAFSGLSSREVISTTGLATFSDAALAERGITTISRAQSREDSQLLLRITDVSAYEAGLGNCSYFPDQSPERLQRHEELYQGYSVAYSLCRSLVPPMRAPMLQAAQPEPPLSLNEHIEKVLITVRILDSMKGSIEAFNKRVMGADRYDRYLRNRLSFAEPGNEEGR